MVEVAWSRKALKQLSKIDSRYRRSIYQKVTQLAAFPDVGLDLKKLTDVENQFRLRIGDYRVIFEVKGGRPIILTILEVLRRSSKTY